MRKSYSTDPVASRLLDLLVADLGVARAYPREEAREYYSIDPYRLKCELQADNLLSKYIFQEDVFKGTEVTEKSIKKFMDNQETLGPLPPTQDSRILDILMRARGWLQETLQEYNEEEHLGYCYFPRKASVGTPRRKATLQHRWLHGLTGSEAHLDWFNHRYLPWLQSSAPRRRLYDGNIVTESVDELNATFVPKTWKSLRMIVPNSGIGGLYSNGLGKVLEMRLRRRGYDIRKLSDIHKSLAQKSSIDDTLATVDQSMASDNITLDVVDKLLPATWAKVLKRGRIGLLKLPSGEYLETETFSMMGVGFTFPLQTLIFLSVVHACYDHKYCGRWRAAPERTISVFGDDLICPREIRPEVELAFAYLGFKINQEKTFWTGGFKESCGGDYYRGLDVRPAKLPQGGQLGKRRFNVWLIKVFNLLHRRWMLEELPRCFEYLLSLMEKRYVVPPNHSDDAGLKLSLAEAEMLGLRVPRRDIHGTYTITFFKAEPRLIKVEYHDVYLWRKLSQMDNRPWPRRPDWFMHPSDDTYVFIEGSPKEIKGQEVFARRPLLNLTPVPYETFEALAQEDDNPSVDVVQGSTFTWDSE